MKSITSLNLIKKNLLYIIIANLLIPQRIERRSHPYQKCALPIKLRNLKYIK